MKNAVKVACFVLAILIIAGTGSYIYLKDVWDFDFIDGPEKGTVVLMGYYGDSKNIVLPDKLRGKKVVSIGEGAFERTDIESVELGKYITNIEKNAFRECKKLKSVKLNEGLLGLGEGAFLSCEALETVNIPSSLEKLNDAVFAQSGIKELDFSKNDNFVLENGVVYSKDMTKIYFAVPKTDLSNYVCPDTVQKISAFAFCRHEELKSFTIPDGVLRLESATFLGCKALKELKIPDSVVYLGPLVVSESGIQKIYIPKQTATIDKSAFLQLENQLTIVTQDNSPAAKFAKENKFKVEIG